MGRFLVLVFFLVAIVGGAYVFERTNTDPAIDVKAGEAVRSLGETKG